MPGRCRRKPKVAIRVERHFQDVVSPAVSLQEAQADDAVPYRLRQASLVVVPVRRSNCCRR